MINVLVADDSALMRRIDCDIINSLQDFCVTDIAFDETSLLKKLRENAFDRSSPIFQGIKAFRRQKMLGRR